MAVQNGIALLGKVNIEIPQGTLFTNVFPVKDATGEDIDVSTGYTAILQAREAVDSETAVIDLDEAAGLTLGDGTITMTLAASATAAYDFEQLGFSLQLTKTAGTEVTELAWGALRLRKSYVQPA